jgi:hypothetical protein
MQLYIAIEFVKRIVVADPLLELWRAEDVEVPGRRNGINGSRAVIYPPGFRNR